MCESFKRADVHYLDLVTTLTINWIRGFIFQGKDWTGERRDKSRLIMMISNTEKVHKDHDEEGQ